MQLQFSCVFMFATGCRARAVCIIKKKENKRKKRKKELTCSRLHQEDRSVAGKIAFEMYGGWLTNISNREEPLSVGF